VSFGVDPIDFEDDRSPERTSQFGALISTNQDFLTGYGKVHGVDLWSPVDDDTETTDHFLLHQVHALDRIEFLEARIQLGGIHDTLLSSQHWTSIRQALARAN
jgi:hypothetical protein